MTPAVVDPRWLEFATQYLGVSEQVGPGSHPTIMGWAKRAGGWIASFFTDDDIPWCALFVNTCLSEAGLVGSKSLAARSFLNWGMTLDEPRWGCIVIFERKGGKGHVGFYVGESEDGTKIRVRGGNQNNRVSDTWIAADRLIGMRWPMHEIVPPPAHIVVADDGTPVSVNEG